RDLDSAPLVVSSVVADLTATGTKARDRDACCQLVGHLVAHQASLQSAVVRYESDAVAYGCSALEEEGKLQSRDHVRGLAALKHVCKKLRECLDTDPRTPRMEALDKAAHVDATDVGRNTSCDRHARHGRLRRSIAKSDHHGIPQISDAGLIDV